MAELETAAKQESEKVETKKASAKTEKTLTYVCNTKCYFNGSIYKAGDTLTVGVAVKLPPYFVVKA